MPKRLLYTLMCLSLYLGMHQGYLALWREGYTEPEKVYPYPISLYPKMDKDLLEKGIPIRSKAELSQRIEDYTS